MPPNPPPTTAAPSVTNPEVTATGNGGDVKQPPAADSVPKVLEGADKIRVIAKSLPADTPDEHVMFGYGGIKVTVADLKKV